MKNPFIAALNPWITNPHERRAEDFLKLSGNNIGNFMFSSSVRRFVRGTAYAKQGVSIDVQKVKESCDGIVIAAANWLQPKNDFSGLAEQIEKADVPTVLTGIGAQSMNGKLPDLQPGAVRMLKAVAERSHSISVRGPFSADTIRRYGIDNVEITGCPSLLWHMTHSAAVTRMPKAGRLGRVSINGTVPGRTVPKHENARMKLGRYIMQQALRGGHDYVTQTELAFLQADRGEIQENDTATLNFLDYVFEGSSKSEMQDYLAHHIRYFPNVPEWLAYCANQDLIIGTRLHGVIAGLLAGTPSVLITHDTRTEEMGKFAGIPTISAKELMEHGDIDPDRILAEADFEAFNKRQESYFDNFVNFFDANEVPHRLIRV